MKNKILNETQLIEKLGKRLSELPNVNKFNHDDNKEAWTIAYSFSDLEDSFRKFNDEYLPKLTQPDLSDAEIENILHEIGEEFRHILYHFRDIKYYKYIASE